MGLTAGTRLGPYEIGSPLGAGGMGEVYLVSTSISAYRMDYEPGGDGQRFLLRVPVEDAAPPSITVVLTWTTLLNK